MGKNTFKITLQETGQSVTTTAYIEPRRFFNSRWTTDKEGKNKITQAKLGETVYFHTDIEGYPANAKLKFKLYDYDETLGLDILNRDDDQFPEDEIYKVAHIKKVNGVKTVSLELYLNTTWEKNLSEDTAYDIELYWEVYYTAPNGKEIKKICPEKIKDCLEVEFSEQDLYLIPAANGYGFPEMIANDGSPMVVMDLSENLYGGKVKTSITKSIQKSIDKKIHKMALTKLEKGMLATNNAGVLVANKQIYGKNYFSIDKKTMELYGNLDTKGERIFLENTKSKYGTYLSVKDGEVLQHRDLITNEGKTFKNVPQPKKLAGAAPVSQYDYFTKTGKTVKFLRTVSKVGNVWDIFSVANFMADDNATSKPLPIPFISPVTDIIMADYNKIYKSFEEKVVSQDLLKAKSEGIEAVRKYVNSQKHNYNKGFDWRLMEVSNETVNQLLNGKFRTFEELDSLRKINAENTIIYKIIKDDKKGEQYEVHSIFINN